MLASFGRLNRDIICERDSQPDMAQTMHLISGSTIATKVSRCEAGSDAERRAAAATNFPYVTGTAAVGGRACGDRRRSRQARPSRRLRRSAVGDPELERVPVSALRCSHV